MACEIGATKLAAELLGSPWILHDFSPWHMTEPTGVLMWTLREQPSRRAQSPYTTDCYVDRLANQWIVLVIRGPETVTCETWDSEENAAHRARELHAILQRNP
jgi:hypothetical protein